MVGLVFLEEEHRYLLNGEELPSVSKVKESLTDFSMVDPETLAKAAAFGTAVHRMVELYFKEALDYSTLDNALFGPLEALEKWLHEIKPFDREEGALIDIKSRKFDRVADPVQVSAYNQLYLENEIREVTIERPLASVKFRFAGTPDIIIPPKSGGPLINWRILYLGLDGRYTYTPAYDPNAWPVFGWLLTNYWRKQQTQLILNSWRNRI